MHRTLYYIAGGYVAICAAVLVRHRATSARSVPVPQPVEPAQPLPAPGGFDGSANEWFAAIKPYCNQVEVVLAHRNHPAPADLAGQALSAACYGLGAKLDSAHAVIRRLPSEQRAQAAGIVFDVAHPVADAGDDRSAGPIMQLVVEYWPNHYMALYHAGMSEYALGDAVMARKHLESFLVNYDQDDGWTRNAREVLARLR